MLKWGEQKAEMGPQDGETTGLWDYETTDYRTKGLQDEGTTGTTGRKAETLNTASRRKRRDAGAVAGLGCLD